MLINIKKYDAFVEITGFRGVLIKDSSEIADIIHELRNQEAVVQFLDSDLVASWEHLYFAVIDALLGFKNSSNLSKSLAIEIALYASAQRQIHKAIEIIGVKSGRANVALVILGKNEVKVRASLESVTKRLRKKPDESVLELSKAKIEKIRRVFGISDAEMAAVSSDFETAIVNLVVERMALLATLI